MLTQHGWLSSLQAGNSTITGRFETGCGLVVRSRLSTPGWARPTRHSSRRRADGREGGARMQRRLLAFAWIAVCAMLAYALVLAMALFTPGYSALDRALAILWALGIGHMLLHSVGYANSMIKSLRGYHEVRRRMFSPQPLSPASVVAPLVAPARHAVSRRATAAAVAARAPKVACLIASYNEPPDVLEETVAIVMSLDYPNKEVVILDDSTKDDARRATRDIARKYGARVHQRANRRGYKAGAINDFIMATDATYVAIFDADALPAHNFLRDLIPIIAENPRLAFVQTPQHYANTDASRVARAAATQAAVFYEYICEGKSHSRAAFCCGTNVIFRREALLALDGQDETTVSEDFATSLNLHFKGWESLYYNRVYVNSIGPETLSAYFTQQSRWAFGSFSVQKRVFKGLLARPGRLRPGQWWEYILSSTYYWVGWVNFIFMLLPALYIFGAARPLRVDTPLYAAVFVPYLVFTLSMFYSGMLQRGYSFRDLLLAQGASLLCFPYYMSGAVAGMMGLKRPFAVTPKGESGKMKWRSLWPQLAMLALSAATCGWGLYRYATGQPMDGDGLMPLALNAFWAGFNALMLCSMFILNRPLPKPRPRFFDAADATLPPRAAQAAADG